MSTGGCRGRTPFCTCLKSTPKLGSLRWQEWGEDAAPLGSLPGGEYGERSGWQVVMKGTLVLSKPHGGWAPCKLAPSAALPPLPRDIWANRSLQQRLWYLPLHRTSTRDFTTNAPPRWFLGRLNVEFAHCPPFSARRHVREPIKHRSLDRCPSPLLVWWQSEDNGNQ